jgi:hypothetical protein
MEHEVWEVLHRHLASIFDGDVQTCRCSSGGLRGTQRGFVLSARLTLTDSLTLKSGRNAAKDSPRSFSSDRRANR